MVLAGGGSCATYLGEGVGVEDAHVAVGIKRLADEGGEHLELLLRVRDADEIRLVLDVPAEATLCECQRLAEHVLDHVRHLPQASKGTREIWAFREGAQAKDQGSRPCEARYVGRLLEELGPLEMLLTPSEEEQERFKNNVSLYKEWAELLNEGEKGVGEDYLRDGVAWWVASFHLKNLYLKKKVSNFYKDL